VIFAQFAYRLPTDLKDAMEKKVSRVRLTAGRVESFTCPADKPQAFLWDTDTPALALRATPTGRKTYVFESRLNGQTIRITIGTLTDWPIEQARLKAQGLKMLVDGGTDPREVERDRQAAAAEKKATAAAKVEADKVAAITVDEVWKDYIEKRRPFWGDLHHRDHVDKAKSGGLPSGRRGGGKKLTQPGPLAALMPLALKELDQTTIETWASNESKIRPSSARLALRLLGVFLTWCGEQPEYAVLLPAKNPAKTRKSRETLGKARKKRDALQREQLPVWFDTVKKIRNPCIAAYLQIMLLTGARPNEILTMQWEGVNTQWKGLTIRDKIDRVSRERTIPLTPYIAHLLSTLPRRNNWVFFSPTSASGHIAKPNNPHTAACTVAGIGHLTLHGLRRSFKSASEWLDIPNGVRQNIMGHVAKSTDEDYTIRPLDLLRVHHEKIEAWILEQAGIVFDATTAPGGLRVVAG
jgi:integrase